jgi:hypothetical protein
MVNLVTQSTFHATAMGSNAQLAAFEFTDNPVLSTRARNSSSSAQNRQKRTRKSILMSFCRI